LGSLTPAISRGSVKPIPDASSGFMSAQVREIRGF
jgi:hypothetical protein